MKDEVDVDSILLIWDEYDNHTPVYVRLKPFDFHGLPGLNPKPPGQIIDFAEARKRLRGA